MKLKSYNILFQLLSFLSDKTNGAPIFVKYKLILGTLILGMVSTAAQAQKKNVMTDSIQPSTPERELITCYKPAMPPKEIDNPTDTIEVKGKVRDELRTFLPGVSVVVKGTMNGVITDIDGSFRIVAKPSDILVFSFIGFETKEISASKLSGGEAIISLEDSNAVLCYEVVVVNNYTDDIYRRRKIKKLSYTEIQTPPVSPAGDLESFQKWVQANVRHTDEMKNDDIKGEVILSFAIDKKGELVDKKVIGKLSEEADKEALRVLSSSAVWKPGIHDGEPMKTTMTISIRFGDE